MNGEAVITAVIGGTATAGVLYIGRQLVKLVRAINRLIDTVRVLETRVTALEAARPTRRKAS